VFLFDFLVKLFAFQALFFGPAVLDILLSIISFFLMTLPQVLVVFDQQFEHFAYRIDLLLQDY
jgi:hypothetical protein